jgi:hypothetical protein
VARRHDEVVPGGAVEVDDDRPAQVLGDRARDLAQQRVEAVLVGDRPRRVEQPAQAVRRGHDRAELELEAPALRRLLERGDVLDGDEQPGA